MESVEAIGRLRDAAFQIDEIVCLVEATDQCMEVIQRIRLVQNGLRQVHDGLLESHLEHCLEFALRHEACSETVLDGIRDVFCCMHRSRW